MKRLVESNERHCEIYLTTSGDWYLDLAEEGHNDDNYDPDVEPEITTYGPFSSQESAERKLDSFSNPGFIRYDDSGTRPVPKKKRKLRAQSSFSSPLSHETVPVQKPLKPLSPALKSLIVRIIDSMSEKTSVNDVILMADAYFVDNGKATPHELMDAKSFIENELKKRNIFRESKTAKITINELRHVVREVLREVNDPEKASQRLVDLVRMTLKDPRNNGPALFGFMRNVGVQQQTIDLVKDVIKKGNHVEAIAVARDVACATFGIRPSSSSSSTSSDSRDACNPEVTKRGLKRITSAA
jgi:hypothetical protein